MSAIDGKHLELVREIAKAEAIKYFANKDYLKKGQTRKQAIDELLAYVLPVKLSTKVICNKPDHCSQRDFFDAAMHGDYTTLIAWANRAGSKTYLISMIMWLKLLETNKRKATILGASQEQSRRAYEAMEACWNIGDSEVEKTPLIREFCKGVPLDEKTKFKNGSRVVILAASDKSTRGPHPDLWFGDEIDAMDTKILETALSGPQSGPDIPMLKLIGSTNHVMGGNMDAQIELIEKSDTGKLFKWCIFECLKPCKGKCSTCKITSFCPGKQMMNATGYYAMSDFVDKLYSLSLFTLKTEWLCDKPGHPDMMYGHEIGDHHFIDISYDPSRVVWLSIDWGGTNPFSVGIWQDFTDTYLNAWVRIDEIYMKNTTNPDVIEEAKRQPWANMIAGAVYDPSRSDLPAEWRKSFSNALSGRGLAMTPANNQVPEGIERVKGALKPVLGPPMVLISKKCRAFISEIYSYKFNPKTGRPVPENDHTMDEFRYFVSWKVNPLVKKAKSRTAKRNR